MTSSSGGYQRERKVYRLRFEDEEMEGLEVRARSAPIGQFIGLAKLANLDRGTVQPDDMDKIDELFRGFADSLVEWNLQDEDGRPVPADLQGIYTQEVDFILQIIFAWIEAIAGVSGTLAAASSDGERSLEASLLMEPRSPSRPSSQSQN